MVGFDLETTAPEPEDARIVSAALVLIGPAEEGKHRDVERRSWLVNPGVEIPEGAIEVHGITNERARAEGGPLAPVLAAIVEAFAHASVKGWPVVIHNARYDLTVADREIRRLGSPLIADLLSKLLVVDPIAIDKHLWRYRSKAEGSRRLADCCRVWNVPLAGVEHDATFDAIAACRLVWRLMTSGKVIRRTRDQEERREFIELTQEWEHVKRDLGLLHAWQQRIVRADSERLEAWFRAGDPRKGVPPMPNRVCPREWPIVPVGTDWGDPTPAPMPSLPSPGDYLSEYG